ncbi:unnamed protein product [Laminaria digitata]
MATAEGGVSAPSTPPSVKLPAVEYASDPESARARRRDRLLGMSTSTMTNNRMMITMSYSPTSCPCVAETVDVRGVAAAVAGQEGKGGAGAGAGIGEGGAGGDGRRSSTGRRLGAMLRRGTPSLHNLRTYRWSKRNPLSSLEVAGAGDLALSAEGDSPVLELDDPPAGHYGRNDSADASSSTSGRRRLSGNNSSITSHRHSFSLPGDSSFSGGGGGGSGGESDGAIGTSSAALFPTDGTHNNNSDDDDDDDDRGRGRECARGPAQSKRVSRLARKAIRPPVQNGDNDFEPAALSSDSEGSGGEDEREPEQPLSAAAAFFGWRRDHSAPPCSRSPPIVDGITQPRAGAVSAAAAAVGSTEGVGEEAAPRGVGGEEGGAAAGAYSRSCLGLDAEDGRSVGKSSAAAAAAAAGVASGADRGPSEADARIARSDTVLFATDSAGGSGMSGGNRRREGGEGGGAVTTTSGDGTDDDANLAANSATPTARQSASRGGSTAGSTRRRLAELLHFRRRRSVGDLSASGSAGSPPHLSSVDAAAAGALDARERATRGPSRPRRSSLRRVQSTSSLRVGFGSMALAADDDDNARARLGAEGSSDEGVDAAAVAARGGSVGGVGGVTDGDSSGVTRGRSSRRRLLPSRSSLNPSAGASASLEPKRYRESFLEAGKHKLRRGRNKLSRSSFGGGGGGESSHRSRTTVPVQASRDIGGARNEEEEKDGVDDNEEQLEIEGASPPAKPQLGTTYTQRPSSAPIESDTAAPWNTWGCSQASDFRVRTKGYAKSRLKAPSAPALYELASVDAYSSPAGRLSGVYPLFHPPAATTSAATPGAGASSDSEDTAGSDPMVDSEGHGEAGGEGGLENGVGASDGDTGHPDIPPVFVVNCQLPDVPTPFSAQGDGPTVHVVFIFHATRQLRRYAAQMAAEERAAAASDIETVAATAEPPTVGVHPSRQTNAAGGEAVRYVTEAVDGGAVDGGGAPAEGELDVDTAGDGVSLGNGRGPSGGGRGEGEGREGREVPGSVRLLAEWTRLAEEDGSFRGRFKAIGDIINADEASAVGLPSIAKRFRGKPLLVYGKESSVVRGPGFVELDLNAHAFSYVGRKGLYVTLDKWKTAIFRIGFLIEGRSDEEQPEHMLGCGILKGEVSTSSSSS